MAQRNTVDLHGAILKHQLTSRPCGQRFDMHLIFYSLAEEVKLRPQQTFQFGMCMNEYRSSPSRKRKSREEADKPEDMVTM